jgi:dihydropteroate synthase
MGVVNVTDDSFYEGSRATTTTTAVERARTMIAEGAAVVDIGGESSRPGAAPVPLEVELERVVPVVEALAEHVTVSVDTVKEAVARAAVAAGATLLNDVGGSLAPVAAELGVGWVAMHAKGTPATMQDDPTYVDVVAEVADWLDAAAIEARRLGVDELWLDPGIGFGKTFAHNWALLAATDRFAELASSHGARLLVGTSRKRFLGEVGGTSLAPDERLAASLATAISAMAGGAAMVRVHDVAPTVQAARLLAEEVAA